MTDLWAALDAGLPGEKGGGSVTNVWAALDAGLPGDEYRARAGVNFI